MKEPVEKPRLRERIYNFFPTLERAERKQLVERIAVGADGGVDFFVMMLLASLGLLEGSTAVVIGAMLVAPLMGPLLAAGFALAGVVRNARGNQNAVVRVFILQEAPVTATQGNFSQ
jgi:hypothetical protein